jgi:hypothetical protein
MFIMHCFRIRLHASAVYDIELDVSSTMCAGYPGYAVELEKEAGSQRNSRCLYADRGMRAGSGLPCRSAVAGERIAKTIAGKKVQEMKN